jgi:two-component system LytT family response regulator
MANFEEVLQDNSLFFRAHKSHIVNLRFIKQYIRGEGGEIIMQDGKNIALSRNKKQDFLSLFKKV